MYFHTIFNSTTLLWVSRQGALGDGKEKWTNSCQLPCVLARFNHDRLSATYGLEPTRLPCPWDSPGKNTGVGCHALLQGILSIQGLNPCLLHWQADSLPRAHLGRPVCFQDDHLISGSKTISWGMNPVGNVLPQNRNSAGETTWLFHFSKLQELSTCNSLLSTALQPEDTMPSDNVAQPFGWAHLYDIRWFDIGYLSCWTLGTALLLAFSLSIANFPVVCWQYFSVANNEW